MAEELNEIPDLQAIFIPTSSGTTAQALGEWFISQNRNVQIHVVQTEAVHPIAQSFDKDFTPQEKSEASAIVDSIAHRKEKIISLVKRSLGSGWIISDNEIRKAISDVKEKTGISLSPNSALAVAGLAKALRQGWQWSGAVVCLVTGQ